jgi:predicted ABC-type transport system involved in lysophospholipase L1 biosynthesis ATPase subunit
MVVLEGVVVELGDRRILDGVEIEVGAGEVVAVTGPSGSGKTTLLNVIAGIRMPDSGEVVVAGRQLGVMSADDRAAHRLRNVGMVFQFGELLPELSVIENVALPARLAGVGRAEAHDAAASWLERVGIGRLVDAHPNTLSGGEAQRAAIARALAPDPSVLLADEPTGALDEQNGQLVVDTLVELARATAAALVIVTHDPVVAVRADRAVRLANGCLLATAEVHP